MILQINKHSRKRFKSENRVDCDFRIMIAGKNNNTGVIMLLREERNARCNMRRYCKQNARGIVKFSYFPLYI